MRRQAVLGALIGAAFLILCLPAYALVVKERTDELAFFEGEGCGSTDMATVTLPKGASGIQPLTPQIGQGIEDLGGAGEVVARITKIERARNGRRVGFRYTATGSDAACAEPDALGWESDGVELVVRYRRRVKVYMAGTDDRNRVRPRIIYIGASQRIYELRWRSWNGRVARGRGIFPFNNCIPYCAAGRITEYPVRVKLSSPRRCGSRFRYLRLTWSYAGRKPPRVGRRGSTTFGYLC